MKEYLDIIEYLDLQSRTICSSDFLKNLCPIVLMGVRLHSSGCFVLLYLAFFFICGMFVSYICAKMGMNEYCVCSDR